MSGQPADWVLAVERAYVAAAMGGAPPAPAAGADPARLARARAAAGAVASRYLAVGTPRTLGLVIGGPPDIDVAALSVEAHAGWFAPRDLRCAATSTAEDTAAAALAARVGGRATSLAEALACDIACVHAPLALPAALLRRGTHVNVLVPDGPGGVTLDDDLRRLAQVTAEEPGLGALAAGLIDGRQLDELTVFVIGRAAIARAAL